MALRKTIKRLIKRAIGTAYKRKDYLDAYAEHTDERVRRDPKSAVGDGELWDVVGTLQFEYMRRHGLRPGHRMLDIGCGTLRGGQHFIRYLESGGYTGMDISSEAIAHAIRLVDSEGLTEKRPRLVVNRGRDLKFSEFSGERFDFLLAQSVFTHLMEPHIEECFAHVGLVMDARSVFLFTFQPAESARRVGQKAFRYPFSFFAGLAAKHRLQVRLMDDYDHPKQARMVWLTKPA